MMGGPRAGGPASALHERFARRNGVPAVAATVFDARGPVEVLVTGVRRRGSSDAALASDRWHIGSCTKSFTAVLWARLVERGDAEWDMPLSAALADLGDVHPGWAGQTIDSALCCRAGFAANLSAVQMQRSWSDTRPLDEQRTEVARRVLVAPPASAGRFVYSNLGYIVVGAAIDRLAGAPFEQALAAHVLEPLEITTAGFGPPAEVWGHPARFQFRGLGLLRGPAVDPADPYSDNPAVLSSAGTMHMSMADWAKFVRIFLLGGSDLLSPDTVDRLVPVPDRYYLTMATGWMRAVHLRGVSYAMQGSNTMWSATAIIDDDRQRAALVACNDGRNRVLNRSVGLAAQLLSRPETNR